MKIKIKKKPLRREEQQEHEFTFPLVISGLIDGHVSL